MGGWQSVDYIMLLSLSLFLSAVEHLYVAYAQSVSVFLVLTNASSIKSIAWAEFDYISHSNRTQEREREREGAYDQLH